MNLSGNQRRVYLLALALLLLAVALVCAWSLWPKSAATGMQSASDTEQPRAAEPSALEATPAPQDAQTGANVQAQSDDSGPQVSTVVYYQDNYGYLVPVMCRVPMEDGIAKATLNRMVQSVDNDMQAAHLGLRTVLPEGTKIDLDIANGLARIDLSDEVLHMADAAAESNMVSAIVQTLTEFDSVDRVEFLIDGQKREKLPHGTSVSGAFTRGDINLETAEPTISLARSEPMTLYFPADSGSVIVPVTRMVNAGSDINTAVLELAKGPANGDMLESVVPAGCGLIDVKVEDGVAKLNFTGEFVNLVQNSDGGRMALRALVLTCTQFDGIRGVELYVDGEKYDAGENGLSVPSFVNVEGTIVNDYIQTQSQAIFDFE